MRASTGPFPPVAMIGTGALIAFTMLAVVIGSGRGDGVSDGPPAETVASVAFFAEDQVDGSIALRDAADGQLITMIRPGQDGFIRSTLRGLAQARQRAGLGRETPFLLSRFDDGRLALRDEAIGRNVTLEAFGRTNARAFARLLPDETRNP